MKKFRVIESFVEEQTLAHFEVGTILQEYCGESDETYHDSVTRVTADAQGLGYGFFVANRLLELHADDAPQEFNATVVGEDESRSVVSVVQGETRTFAGGEAALHNLPSADTIVAARNDGTVEEIPVEKTEEIMPTFKPQQGLAPEGHAFGDSQNGMTSSNLQAELSPELLARLAKAATIEAQEQIDEEASKPPTPDTKKAKKA